MQNVFKWYEASRDFSETAELLVMSQSCYHLPHQLRDDGRTSRRLYTCFLQHLINDADVLGRACDVKTTIM